MDHPGKPFEKVVLPEELRQNLVGKRPPVGDFDEPRRITLLAWQQ